jgi:DNA-binding SARP family transcriptional activator
MSGSLRRQEPLGNANGEVFVGARQDGSRTNQEATSLPANVVAGGQPAETKERLLSDVFELFPYGIAVSGRTGAIVAWNRALEEVLGVGGGDIAGASCCELFGCWRPGGPLESGCLTAEAIHAGSRLRELRLSLPSSGRIVWVTAAPLYANASRVVMQVRPSAVEQPRGGSADALAMLPQLYLYTLGPTRVETSEGPLAGEWLERRSGQLLKFLACERHRVVATDEIAEAVWPNPRAATPGTVRYFVHELREKLEPGRPRHARSAVVQARRGGYMLDDKRVWIDADEFEARVNSGLAAFARGEAGTATDHLERALSLYRGDFLSDAPYAEWALSERERLRELAEKPLSLLCELRKDDLDTAAGYLERLAEMEPFDQHIQRQLLLMWLRQGRSSRALRHYHALRLRLLREFGEGPSFTLSDLVHSGKAPKFGLAHWRHGQRA